MSDPAPAFVPYDVTGVGTVTAHNGDSYIVRMLDGRVCGFPASGGTPSESSAVADIAAGISNPPHPPSPVDLTPVGGRRSMGGSFRHSEIATSSGGTLLGVVPSGYAMVDFQARIDEAFDAGRTLSCGTAASPARWVNALAVSTVGLKQATPLQLYPQSVAADTPVYLKKSAATTVGDIIKVTALVERKY